MKIEIETIQKKGGSNQEYIDLKVKDACDLQYYKITDTTYTSNNKISNKHRHSYWFLSQQVKAGDYVRLYTGKGTNTSYTNTSYTNTAKTTTYVYYWGLDVAVWNNDGDGAVLFEINTWTAKKA